MQANDQYLTFFLAGEEYAITILQVTDIIECGVVTRVPGTPPWIRGVHNLRGTVVPVIDLAIKFGLPATEITRRTCVVIVELRVDDEAVIMGVMTDSVHQVVDFTADQIQPAPSFGPRVRAGYLLGMASSTNSKFVLLLDINRIFSSDEIVAVGSTADGGTSDELPTELSAFSE